MEEEQTKDTKIKRRQKTKTTKAAGKLKKKL